MKYILFIFIAILFISACSDDEKTIIKSKPLIETSNQQSDITKKSNFADPQIQAYKKAQTVQSTLDIANQKRQEEMEKQGL